MRTISILTLVVGAVFAAVVLQREVDLAGNVQAIIQTVTTAVSQHDPVGLIALLKRISPLVSVPSTPQEALQDLQAIFDGASTPPADIFEYAANLRALNLVDSLDSLATLVQGDAVGQSSTNNINPDPPKAIYPQRSSCDTPYTIDETTLRSAIYIPSTFNYGEVPPVILFPGTGNYGYETFAGNFIPLLTGSDFADPVWVNVPGRLLNDAQKNAEFAAYAINYIASITNGNVTMLAWSQGNIDTQWAFKYWPSTTQVTSDHIAISPDYAGTVTANFFGFSGGSSPPSILQQRYLDNSKFITTLRSCNGDSGYVPTTTIYSGVFDEVVEPMQGTGASAYLNDARGVGVTNNEIQIVCPGQPAGSFYTHEGVLFNPIAYYLLRDAMSNAGPGRAERLPAGACATYLTPGLTVDDVLVTENAIAIAGMAILTYPNPVTEEPAIADYARACPMSNCLAAAASSSSAMSTTSTAITSVTMAVTTLTTYSSMTAPATTVSGSATTISTLSSTTPLTSPTSSGSILATSLTSLTGATPKSTYSTLTTTLQVSASGSPTSVLSVVPNLREGTVDWNLWHEFKTSHSRASTPSTCGDIAHISRPTGYTYPFARPIHYSNHVPAETWSVMKATRSLGLNGAATHIWAPVAVSSTIASTLGTATMSTRIVTESGTPITTPTTSKTVDQTDSVKTSSSTWSNVAVYKGEARKVVGEYGGLPGILVMGYAVLAWIA